MQARVLAVLVDLLRHLLAQMVTNLHIGSPSIQDRCNARHMERVALEQASFLHHLDYLVDRSELLATDLDVLVRVMD